MEKDLNQQLGNLPAEILALPRWLKTRKNNRKAPVGAAWQKAENQKMYSELSGVRGFVASTETEGGLIFYDFDHALTDSGEPVNDKADYWLKIIQAGKFYAELSQSNRGAHMFGKPTAGKFGKINDKLYLTADKKSFIEIFYGTTKFCLPTGNLFRCEPQTPIAQDEVADNILQTVLDALNEQNSKAKSKQGEGKGKQDSTLVYQSPDSAGYDLWRATKMLDYINPEQLDYDNWFAVFTACKTVGLSYAVVDAWSRRDTTTNGKGKPRYNETENLTKWNEPINPAYNIETLAGKARDCGYNEKDSWREWCELHPEFKGKVTRRPAPMSDDDSDEREDFIWTQDRIKSCPVNLRLPDNYKFNKSGIYLVVETKKETKYICAARTPILPTEKFREPIKGTIEYKFTILDSGKWRNVEIDGGALADTRELSKTLSRHGAQIKKSEPLREFLVDILSLNPDLKEIKTYSRTGWHDGKFIYPTGGTDYIVRRPNFNFEEICKPKGNAELWKQKFKEVMEQGGATAQVFFGVALSAPLAEPIIGANPSAQLFGKSGGGKTGLQKFVSSFYGNPRELVRTFAATNKNRLLVADAFNGLPTFLDELETVQGKAAEEALSTDVYNFYDGTGNQANKRDGNAREMFKFRASRLATGERQILKQHDLRGAYKRLLPLKAKANFLPDELATDLHFFSESNYGHFGKVWIDFVAEHLEEIKKQYEFCAKFYAPLKRYEPTHLKMLAAAVVSVEFFSVAIGVKNEFDKAACVRNMRAIVDTLPTTDELDDTTRAVESLSSYVASHTKSFNRPVKDPDTGKINEVVAWGIVCNGRIFENGEVAFLPTELRRILEDELKFPSANKLINEWKEQGNVLITDKDRLTHKAPIGDDRPRTIHFKARILVTCPDDEELLYYEEKGVV